jgi:hypothetical protein
LLLQSCRDRLLEDQMIEVMTEPFDHLGIGRLACLEAARPGDKAEEIAPLGEIEGGGDRFAFIRRTHHRGRTAIAGHGEDPHRHHPSNQHRTNKAELKCFEMQFNRIIDIYYINSRFSPGIIG